MSSKTTLRLLASAASLWVAAGAAHAQDLDGPALAALREGGHVLVMRHAQSPRQPPAADAASPGNAGLERELDETGRATAAAMGEAVRELEIPIGEVLSSPTFRALQTVRSAELGEPRAVPELDAGGNDERAAWLRATAAEPPADGRNTLIVTHAPNISRAFGEAAAAMADGEALVVRPDGGGRATVLGRIRIEEWPALAGP